MKVVFNEIAKDEFEDAIEFYELEYPGLGEKFREEIKKSVKRLFEHPNAWPVERAEVRKYLVHKFPYRILYSIEKDHIYIGYHLYWPDLDIDPEVNNLRTP